MLSCTAEMDACTNSGQLLLCQSQDAHEEGVGVLWGLSGQGGVERGEG